MQTCSPSANLNSNHSSTTLQQELHACNTHPQADVLIIGGGAAGLSAAIRLANLGYKINLLYKTNQPEGASYWAQGGIATMVDKEDNFDSHIQDTLTAGAGLCNLEAVEFVVKRAPEQLNWLLAQGVDFSKDENGHLHLTREGGHSKNRIVHADDATGKAIQTRLWQIAQQHTNITSYAHYLALDLITQNNHTINQTTDQQCYGVYAYNTLTQRVEILPAKTCILATGGASRVYLYTTNPEVASGDGIAMAWRAGAQVANLEFNQFHPTCLYHLQSRTFLLTEALRGEGAFLRLPTTGERFMLRYHELAELAPRDVVARSIDLEMKKNALDYVHLDITHRSLEFILAHFPNIYQHCLSLGIDISKQTVPVVPAAHYTCGGVVSNLHGQSSIKNLYAIGEVACTGLHGANRLASNSLLECFVFADSASKHIDQYLKINLDDKLPNDVQNQAIFYSLNKKQHEDTELNIAHNWDSLRRTMWDYVGIMRSHQRLHQAKKRVQAIDEEIESLYNTVPITPNLIELRNLVHVALLTIDSALVRKESRGLHYNTDYPLTLPMALDTILQKS